MGLHMVVGFKMRDTEKQNGTGEFLGSRPTYTLGLITVHGYAFIGDEW